MRTSPPLDLVTVYSGSHARVVVLEGLLDAEGIPNFVPDRMMKTVDPFLTGSSPLELRLKVPATHLAAARELVARAFPEPEPRAPRSVRIRWLWLAALRLLPIVGVLLLELLDTLGR
jgi:hypothetical protein